MTKLEEMHLGLFQYIKGIGECVLATHYVSNWININGKRIKSESITSGIPHVFLPRLKLFIELKSKRGKLSLKKERMHDILRKSGYDVKIFHDMNDCMIYLSCSHEDFNIRNSANVPQICTKGAINRVDT